MILYDFWKLTVLISDDSSESNVDDDFDWLYEDDPPMLARMPSEESSADWVNEVDMNEG